MRYIKNVVLAFSFTVLTFSVSAVVAQMPNDGTIQQVTTESVPLARSSFTKPAMTHELSEPQESRVVDIGQTVQAFAKLKNIAPEEARLETINCLGIQPRIKRAYLTSEMPTFEVLDDDRIRIFARKSYFDNLPSLLAFIESGKKQVVVNCLIVSIDPKDTKRINAFISPGTAAVNCSTIPKLKPIATADDMNEEGDFISTSTTITTNTPAVTGNISTEKLKELIKYFKNSDAEFKMTPRIIMYPGQVGVISDAAERPFVVGLEAAHDHIEHAGVQPVIQAIEDGVTLRLKAIPMQESIQILGDIAISEVHGVETITFASSGTNQQQSIQVPSQRLRQIHLASTIPHDTAILIDPNFVQEVSTSDSRKKTQKRKTVFVLQATVITPEE